MSLQRILQIVTVHDENSFSYEEDTQLQIKGQSELFHHIDKNTLKRLPSWKTRPINLKGGIYLFSKVSLLLQGTFILTENPHADCTDWS